MISEGRWELPYLSQPVSVTALAGLPANSDTMATMTVFGSNIVFHHTSNHRIKYNSLYIRKVLAVNKGVTAIGQPCIDLLRRTCETEIRNALSQPDAVTVVGSYNDLLLV